MKRFLLLFLIAVVPFAATSSAEKKPVKPAKLSTLVKAANLAIKNESGQDAAEKNLLAALPRTDISDKNKAYIYLLAAQLEESKNGVENRKAYLKQKYDTASFFNSLLTMYQHLRLCDSIDAVPHKGKVKIKYASKTRALRLKHKQNILSGGKFFLSKDNYDLCYQYMDQFCTYAELPKDDDLLLRTSYTAALCGYLTSKHDHTLKYIEDGLKAALPQHKPILLEHKVQTYIAMKDDASVLRELDRGVHEYPSHDYFFVHLVDIYYAERNYDKGLALADSLIALDPSKPIYWYTKSKLELAENDYYKCIEYSDSTINRDEKYVDAYYNKGISLLNLALIEHESACTDMNDPKCVEDRRRVLNLYQNAKPCMEMVRKLQPDQTERWANPLYRIYLNLNMGKEFDEIDKILHPKK